MVHDQNKPAIEYVKPLVQDYGDVASITAGKLSGAQFDSGFSVGDTVPDPLAIFS